jgi:transcriptional regulator with XRE-family HTH domain
MPDLLRDRDIGAIFRFLRARGWSRATVAAAVGLTENRVRQIAQGRQKVTSYEVLERIADGLVIDRSLLGLGYASGDQNARSATPEAGFLGNDTIVIITPRKREEINARPVVAVEDVLGAHNLGEMARTLGLKPLFETIPDGGDINLCRPGLVVICGPRLSTRVADILAQDPRFQFVQAADGTWTLRDELTGTAYRSGQDQTPPVAWDVAYLGRLPRPDRNGTLLIFTGIHPQGSLGVVDLITNRLSDLYHAAGDGCFSTLVGTEYEPATGRPQRVDLLTSVTRWDPS